MKKSRSIFITVIMLCALLFTGCWNYADVEQQFVVMGLIVDYNEDEAQYIMYAEVSRAKGGSEAESITRIEKAAGTTLFDANRNLVTKIGSKVYWGHAMVYVISERVAELGISDVIGILSNLTQVRTDISIMVSDNESIEKIFEFEDPIHDNVSQHLHDLMTNYESSGEFAKAPLFLVIQQLASDETSLMLPCIKMVKDEKKEEEQNDQSSASEDSGSQSPKMPTEILVIDGSAIFKKDKIIGKLDKQESMVALILRDEISKGYAVTLENENELPNATVEVMKSSKKIHTTVSDSKVYIKIELKIEADLIEIQTNEDYYQEEKLAQLEKALEEMLGIQMMKAIMKNQDEYGADIFSFAGYVHRQNKEYWKSHKHSWDKLYEDAYININTDVKITSSALTFKPVKVGK